MKGPCKTSEDERNSLREFETKLRTQVSGAVFIQIKINKQKHYFKKSKRKVQRVPQSQAVALPRHQEEEETDKTKQEQIEQMYKKH